jgi:hypothetical protein
MWEDVWLSRHGQKTCQDDKPQARCASQQGAEAQLGTLTPPGILARPHTSAGHDTDGALCVSSPSDILSGTACPLTRHPVTAHLRHGVGVDALSLWLRPLARFLPLWVCGQAHGSEGDEAPYACIHRARGMP